MSFKINNNLTSDIIPVKETSQDQKVYTCAEYKGEYSSVTGIIAKFLFIAKINQFTCEHERPTVRIVCGPECVEKCINFNKK